MTIWSISLVSIWGEVRFDAICRPSTAFHLDGSKFLLKIMKTKEKEISHPSQLHSRAIHSRYFRTICSYPQVISHFSEEFFFKNISFNFQIGEGVHQGCILSPCLFNLYAEYIMWNAGLDEAQAGIKIAGGNINNLRYSDDTTLMVISSWKWKC